MARDDSDENAMSRDADTVLLTPEISRDMFSFRKGRRYNAITADHFLPNDEEEIFRLKLQHKAVIRALGMLHTVPIQSFKRVLDAGCGPGWWAIDFADAYPQCEVTGVDLVPIQPQDIPPNLSFECDDICQGLRFPDHYFDMVYSRKLFSSITDWSKYMSELVRVLKPGGVLNCVEVDIDHKSYNVDENTRFGQWQKGLVKTLWSLKLNPSAATDLMVHMEAAGLVDVSEHWFNIPGGTSTRATAHEQETARLLTQTVLLSISSVEEVYGAANNLHDEDLDLFMSEVRRDLVDPSIEWHGTWVSVVGRKV